MATRSRGLSKVYGQADSQLFFHPEDALRRSASGDFAACEIDLTVPDTTNRTFSDWILPPVPTYDSKNPPQRPVLLHFPGALTRRLAGTLNQNTNGRPANVYYSTKTHSHSSIPDPDTNVDALELSFHISNSRNQTVDKEDVKFLKNSFQLGSMISIMG